MGSELQSSLYQTDGKRIAGHMKGNHAAHISSYENEKKKCQTWTEKRKLERSKAVSDLKPGCAQRSGTVTYSCEESRGRG